MRALSSALVNRVLILNVRVDVPAWLKWADTNEIRSDVKAFINFDPSALARPVPADPSPFSTPRSWASLSRALELVEQKGILDDSLRRALAFGRVSPADAAVFCALAEHSVELPSPIEDYLTGRVELPVEDSGRWFILNWIRERIQSERSRLARTDPIDDYLRGDYILDGYELDENSVDRTPLVTPEQVNAFLLSLPEEHRFALLVDSVTVWAQLGADESLLRTLVDVIESRMPANTERDFPTAVKVALDLVCVSLPHFSGLARAVRVVADDRVRTAGIFASGRLVVNTEWFLEFNSLEQAFVIAHELLHLGLPPTSGAPTPIPRWSTSRTTSSSTTSSRPNSASNRQAEESVGRGHGTCPPKR